MYTTAIDSIIQKIYTRIWNYAWRHSDNFNKFFLSEQQKNWENEIHVDVFFFGKKNCWYGNFVHIILFLVFFSFFFVLPSLRNWKVKNFVLTKSLRSMELRRMPLVCVLSVSILKWWDSNEKRSLLFRLLVDSSSL